MLSTKLFVMKVEFITNSIENESHSGTFVFASEMTWSQVLQRLQDKVGEVLTADIKLFVNERELEENSMEMNLESFGNPKELKIYLC